MSNDTQTQNPSPDDLARIKRQLSERAVKFAVANRWDDALAVNQDYVRIFPNDSDGYNRLGKSLAETGNVSDARNAYNRALELDPTNAIAERNLDRLATIEASGGQGSRSTVDTRLFVGETGKTAVALLQAVEPGVVDGLDAGDLLNLTVSGNAVNAETTEGDYAGMVEPRIGLRLSRLMKGGNTYAAALLTANDEVRIIIREMSQHSSQADLVSFPQSTAAEMRPYVGSRMLRRIDRLSAIEPDDGDEGFEDGGEESWDDDPRGMRIVNTSDLANDYDE